MDEIKFLIDILNIESISRNKKGLNKILNKFEEVAKKNNLEIIKDDEKQYLIIGRGNLLKPKIGMLCHLDTVSPFFESYKKDGKIYGRGSIDMKGPTVSCFFALLESNVNNISLLLTCDEEIGGMVAEEMSEKYKPEILIVPDQDDNYNLTLSSKGVIHFEIDVKGETAHGSRPWQGKNAIELIWNELEFLKKKLNIKNEPGRNNTLNLSYIKTPNKTLNVVPDETLIGLDFRFAYGNREEWIKKINELNNEFISIKILITAERWEIEKNEYFEIYRNIVKEKTGKIPEYTHGTGSCDGRFYVNKVKNILMTRPPGGKAHAPDEYIEEKIVIEFKEILKKYFEKIIKD